MQSQNSAVAREKVNSKSSSSLPDSRLMDISSNFPSSSVQSLLFPVEASPPRLVVNVRGHTLIAPNSSLARAIVMGNQESAYGADHDETQKNGTMHFHQASGVGTTSVSTTISPHPANLSVLTRPHGQQNNASNKPISNLPALLNNHYYNNDVRETLVPVTQVSEADSASGPAPPPPPSPPTVPLLGQSAPNYFGYTNSRYRQEQAPPPPQLTRTLRSANASEQLSTDKVRRCMSSKELGTLAPPSGSPYANLLSRKHEIEAATRNRLHELRKAEANAQWRRESLNIATSDSNDLSTSASTKSQQHECANELRNRRRAEHAKAVVDDLCDVVADLYIAESKLLDPRNYGVPHDANRSVSASSGMIGSKEFDRSTILSTIHSFVSSLPLRYALGADTPSEVLLHMRLMAAARSDRTKAALHIHNLDDDNNWSTGTILPAHTRNHTKGADASLRLVTISCHDCTGLLEYISRLLASSGSRVLDADVMLSKDGIVLDRFVVQMTGRLRLATMVNLIENFLREATMACKNKTEKEKNSPESVGAKGSSPKALNSVPEAGPLYFKSSASFHSHETVEDEMLRAIPLSDMLTSSSDGNFDRISFPKLRKMRSMPSAPSSSLSTTHSMPSVRLQIRNSPTNIPLEVYTDAIPTQAPPTSFRERRPLVNRRGLSDLDRDAVDSADDISAMDYLTVPSSVLPSGAPSETRVVPLIPFDELMLIESIGTGRVSTIYRAAWRRNQPSNNVVMAGAVQMVALKVAMVNPSTGDTSHIDELRREADIAARLQHPNICDLVGVAADPECFCLAYEFCEGGSLLSLLTNHSRYYEYLPIALDIAQGMAFLHKKSIIHRDLKPANILLTRDHRAKIADFGMSINNHGQELTAETGTYRYMAPEVIRHETYSSNADVYSFGICLWQLITREIPFSTMTPIQAAYAVAEGHRPEIPASTPLRLQEIIRACWDHDSQRRPSFTYVAMALADYVKMAFSPANVGTLTLQIANEMLATVEGNSTINVDFSTPVAGPQHTPHLSPLSDVLPPPPPPPPQSYFNLDYSINDSCGNLGLEIE